MNGVVDKWVYEWITGHGLTTWMGRQMVIRQMNDLQLVQNQMQEWLEQEWLLTRT